MLLCCSIKQPGVSVCYCVVLSNSLESVCATVFYQPGVSVCYCVVLSNSLESVCATVLFYETATFSLKEQVSV